MKISHTPRKRFSQNFLQDAMIIHRIVEAIAPVEGDRLIEIGPGLGALTHPLLQRVKKMVALELDRDVIPKLAERCKEAGELTIISGDALKFDYASLGSVDHPLRVVGNLPYHISTELLFVLFGYADIIKDMHFMLQKEVIDRMAAAPGNKTYGRLSVMAQYFGKISHLFDVPPHAFYPQPKVMSSIVRIIPYAQKPFVAKDFKRFAEMVTLAFNQRRKTLRNGLSTCSAPVYWEAAGIDPARRAETLSVEEFVRLSNAG